LYNPLPFLFNILSKVYDKIPAAFYQKTLIWTDGSYNQTDSLHGVNLEEDINE